MSTTSTDAVADGLDRITSGLPGGGEHRSGQHEMAAAVTAAIREGRHLVVQAGTGTGKSLAYLVPAVLSGKKVVVATATKALQDQLATKDLPMAARALCGPEDPVFTFAVLKGRSNYICRQRIAELASEDSPPSPDDSTSPPPVAGFAVSLFSEESPSSGGTAGSVDSAFTGSSATSSGSEVSEETPIAVGPQGSEPPNAGISEGKDAISEGKIVPPQGLADQIRHLIAWSSVTRSGDRAELDFEPDQRAWAAVSVGSRECPGAFRCPSGSTCLAEAARARAAAADIVVVNTHLYASHVASDGAVLPEHDVLVIDEAHELEEIMTSGLGVELSAGRLRSVSSVSRPLLAKQDSSLADELASAGEVLEQAMGPIGGKLVPADYLEVQVALALTTRRAEILAGALRRTTTNASEPTLLRDTEVDPEAVSKRARATLALEHLVEDLHLLVGATAEGDQIMWVDGVSAENSPKSNQGSATARGCTLRLNPINLGPLLTERIWGRTTAVLTSATLPTTLPQVLGLPEQNTDRIDFASPFPYRDCSLLYVAKDLPDRRSPEAEAAIHDEIERLARAAGGRMLALFTSRRAMEFAASALRIRLPFKVLAQDDLPKTKLIHEFAADPETCLFATASFWQGIDVPGPSLSLVVIDRLPFPRPDDPLIEARRARAGPRSFALVDLPRASTMLAQGVGRLIRSSTDRGVVAVLDSRLATAGYRAALLAGVPPMKRTVDRAEVESFLSGIAGSEAPHP